MFRPLSQKHEMETLAVGLSRLEGWLSTYYCYPGDGRGGIGGPIATYWASSAYTAGPQIMNVYGVVRGLCCRAGDVGGEAALRRAASLVDYLLQIQDSSTGLFICSGGETPFTPPGLIHQASAVAALWHYAIITGEPEVIAAANRGWQACVTQRSLQSSWIVINQALRACTAAILGMQADAITEVEARAIVTRVVTIAADMQYKDEAVAGAIPQSKADDSIIMPYQGKCLEPLVQVFLSFGDERALQTAIRLADFVVAHGEPGTGLVRGALLPEGKLLAQGRCAYRLRLVAPFAERPLRSLRQRMIKAWRAVHWPIWIARSADTARGLWKLARVTGNDVYLRTAHSMLDAMLACQTLLGGIRNSRGFFGTDPAQDGPSWQDVAPIPRWNAYLVHWLHELLQGTSVRDPELPAEDARDEVALAEDATLVETKSSLTLLRPDSSVAWSLRKGHRWGWPFRQVQEWDEGSCQQGMRRRFP